MAEPRIIRLKLKTLTTAQKRKFATDRRRLCFELGRLVLSWALLQERLAGILQQALSCPPHLSNSMWHSIKSDLVQRQMLVAALKSSSELLKWWKDDPEKQNKILVFGEYVRAINEITKFSHGRNDLIHSPIMFYLASEATEVEAVVSDFHGNPRAEKLKDKELYQLCRWMVGFCDDMDKYISSIWQHVHKHGKLPKRPKFKSLLAFPTRKQRPVRTKRRNLKRMVKNAGSGP
jgi:hypothetical protein